MANGPVFVLVLHFQWHLGAAWGIVTCFIPRFVTVPPFYRPTVSALRAEPTGLR